MPRPRRKAPSDHAVDGDWPDATLDGDPAAEAAQHLARALRDAIAGTSLRAAAARTGVDHTAIADIVNGTGWCDSRTLALLEHGLGTRLWPGR